MSFCQSDAVRYYQFESFDGLPHGVFTRKGGVSPLPWAELNLGGTVGDDPDRVLQNRSLLFRALGLNPLNSFDVWQVHGNNVVCTRDPRLQGSPYRQADAILTDRPGLSLLMRFADCVPILLWDPVKKVVGLVHAGWQGTIKQTAASAIRVMQSEYGSNPPEILAGIGPSIAAHHYPVGAEVIKQVRQVFGSEADQLIIGDSKDELDLWKANQFILEKVGVKQIEISGICTACNLGDWYSHRAEAGRTGRFGVLIGLPE
jgi:polyphenol oxidase